MNRCRMYEKTFGGGKNVKIISSIFQRKRSYRKSGKTIEELKDSAPGAKWGKSAVLPGFIQKEDVKKYLED